MDALLLIIIIGMTLLMIGVSIYLLIVYVHPDDKGWGTAVYCKILVVLGMILIWAQALMLPLDVANNHFSPNSGGIDMKTLWSIIYMITLAMITILLPFSMLFYETDEQNSFCKRFLSALCYLTIALIVVIIILFVSWAFLKFADIPITTVTVDYGPASSMSNDQNQIGSIPNNQSQTTMQITTSFVVYCMAIMSFVGWILLVLFGGVGLFALPIDWFNDFRRRPKPRRSEEMLQIKENLAKTVEELKKACQQLKVEEQGMLKNDEAGFFQKLKNKRAFQTKMSMLTAQYSAVEEQYAIFQRELKYEKSNPLTPWLKLFLAIIFLITSILWIFQLIFGYLAMKNSRPLVPFLNQLFIYMENSNAGFIATFLYSYFILYLVWAVVKGNVKFGIRIPLIVRFYPMKKNETWMNSFLFNIIMLLIASVGITQLATGCFPTYTRNTAIYNMFGLQVNYMRFYKYLYDKKVFGYALVVWAFLSLIYLLFTCRRPAKHEEEIAKIRKDHGRIGFQAPKTGSQNSD